MCTYTDNVVATGGNKANGVWNNVQTGNNGINSYGYGNNAVLTGNNEANGIGNEIGTGNNQINSREMKEQSIPNVYLNTTCFCPQVVTVTLLGPKVGVVNWFAFSHVQFLKLFICTDNVTVL